MLQEILTYTFLPLSLISLFFYTFFMAKRPEGYQRKPLEIVFMILSVIFIALFVVFALQIEYAIYFLIGFAILSIIIMLTTFIIVSKKYQTR